MDSRNILLIIWVLQLATLVSIFFNIAFARQLLGFLFLTFVPGYLMLRISKLDNLPFSFIVFLSVGLSIAILMLIGLLLNSLLPILGLLYSLSTFSMIASVNLFVLVSSAYLWVRYQSSLLLHIPYLRLLPGIILLIGIPSLTVIGVGMARLGNTLVLMMLVALVSLIVLCAFSAKLIPAESHPLVILAIALSLLFHVSLISNYVIGSDVHMETYFAQLTSANSFWDRTLFHPYNAMISVTILPVVYERFLNVDSTWIFKIVYPLVYSLVPLILYFAFRKHNSSLVALLAVFFFMSMDTFYVQMLGLARQMIGEVFLALLIFLIVDGNMDIRKRRLLFYVFSVALLFSHYSIAYIFLFLALVTFSVSHYFKGVQKVPIITGKFLVGYALTTSLWYVFAVPAASKSLADNLNLIYNSLISNAPIPGPNDLLPPATSLLRQVGQYQFYVLQLFIIAGVIVLIVMRNKSRIDSEYAGMSVGSLLLLLMSVALPSFAASLNMTRIYHLSLFLLAPFCVLGGLSIVESIANMKSRSSLSPKEFDKVLVNAFSKTICAGAKIRRTGAFLIAFLLISIFLFQVGFTYKIAGDNNTGSISLSRDRMNSWTIYMNQLYLDDPEVSALKFFAKYRNNESKVYADWEGVLYLMSYGSVSPLARPQRLDILEPETSTYWVDVSYIYFDRLNLDNHIFTGYSTKWNSTDWSRALSILNETDQIYSNGGSTLYCGHSTGMVSLPQH